MVQDGSMMSNIGRWLREEKSFEITGASIVGSLAIILFIAGFLSGIRWDQLRSEVIEVQGKRYQFVALAKPNVQDDIYMPLYKELR